MGRWRYSVRRAMPDSSLPDVSHPDFAPYWEAARGHRLVVMACADCHVRRWPPRPVCRACGSQRVEWPEVSGRGRLYSWTVVGRAVVPGFETVPYTVAVGQLDDEPGIRLLATLDNSGSAVLRIGRPLEIVFRERALVSLPVWRLLGDACAR